MPMPDCVQQDCCPPDPYSYRSADAEDSQAGSRAQCHEVIVEISPVSGSYLFFPSYVILSADHEDAVIRYTLDGTDPTVASTLYSAPFQITQSGQLLKARVFIDGCSPGPISTALYQNPPFPIGFGYGCTTPDNAGTWNGWAANGTVDNHWQLVFTPSTPTGIQRLDVSQLDTNGALSGIRWSTDSAPNPSQEDLHNPSVWLKADAIPGLADGAAIASWADSTGNGNNATQATGAKQPLYKTAIVNSKPVVRFDGTDDEFAASMPVGAAKTVVLVVKKRSAIGGTGQAAYGVGAVEQLVANSAVSPTTYYYWEGPVILGIDPTAWAIVTLKHESLSVVKIYLNDLLDATADPSDSFAAASSFTLGSNGLGALFGDYDIAEVLVYDTALTDAQRLDVYAYLEEKYFDPAPTYATWPLLVFVSGAQQWASYQNMLGIFAASAHTLDLYGDRQFPVSGFFRFDMTLGDGSVVSSIINTTCNPTLPPVACPSPGAPTVTPLCDGEATVTFPGTIGQAFKVYVGQTLVRFDAIGVSPQDVHVTGLIPGSIYHFRLELEYPGCGFQSSIVVSALLPSDPTVSIATTKTLVDPNESFTISWTSNNIGGATCGGCLDGEVSINQGLGCKAGNTPGSQATSKVTPGVYTYEITGCNTCGTVTASVQVEVRDVASCSVEPGIITISNWTTFLCGFFDLFGAPGTCKPGCHTSIVATNGQLPRTGSCLWEGLGVEGGCVQDIGGSGFYLPMNVTVQFITDRWHLTVIFLACGGERKTAWTGEKLFGNSPLGAYTKTGGCASGPATITVT